MTESALRQRGTGHALRHNVSAKDALVLRGIESIASLTSQTEGSTLTGDAFVHGSIAGNTDRVNKIRGDLTDSKTVDGKRSSSDILTDQILDI